MSRVEADGATPPISRRERARLDTTAEILRVARRIVVEDGVEGLSLRPVANELGMTAPALYRYFPSRDDLVNHVVVEIYDELAVELGAARAAEDDPLEQLLAVARHFRRWALAHPREFGLVFVNPVRMRDPQDLLDPVQQAGLRVAAVFAEPLAALYTLRPFAVAADKDIEPELRRELEQWQRRFPIALPLGALLVFLTGWVRIYGMVCMEVFGHLQFALADGEPMYEHVILGLADLLGGRVSPRRRSRGKPAD